jgi:predicted metalloprotease
MRWTPGGSDQDIEDRRSQGGGRRGGGLKVGLVGVLILLGLSLLTGRNFLSLLDTSQPVGPGAGPAPDPQRDQREAPQVEFVKFVLNDAQDTWQKVLPEYRRAKLVLFRDAVESGCGFADAGAGPFYCPADDLIYIDLEFLQQLERQLVGESNDLAEQYIIAHEYGHHVQNILGFNAQVQRAQRSDPDRANQYSVALELQADCYAGVWVGARNVLENPAELDEAIAAAEGVGDDRIQQTTQGRIDPESWTHGSAEQRKSWFLQGFNSKDPRTCDATFEEII